MTARKDVLAGCDDSGGPPVIFLSSSDPLDIRSFSTTLFYMVSALRQHFPNMDIVRHSRPPWFARLERIVRRLSGGRANPNYWTPLNRRFAAHLARRWRGRGAVVIAVVNSTLVAELASELAVINVSDATFALMRDFYPANRRFDSFTARAGEAAERRAIRQSAHNCFSSGWAARSAIEHYGARAEDVSVVPWGCNLPYVEPARARLSGGSEPWRLLFVGGDWRRKGGDIVLETFGLLQARGLPVALDIVGTEPDGGAHDLVGVTCHGFLGKADDAQLARLFALYRDAAFLFLPTRQDCTPMVFSEANAFGTPALTRDVGGVGGVVENGVNGYLLRHDGTAEDFADAIERSFHDRTGYDQLRRSSRRTYDETLNWPAWASEIRTIVATLAAAGRP